VYGGFAGRGFWVAILFGVGSGGEGIRGLLSWTLQILWLLRLHCFYVKILVVRDVAAFADVVDYLLHVADCQVLSRLCFDRQI